MSTLKLAGIRGGSWNSAALFAVGFAIAAGAWAQGEASISGVISDGTGSALPETNVTVRSEETGILRRAVTDLSGHYDISLLGVGSYEVTAEKTGFQTA